MRDAENIRQLALLEPDYIGFIFYPKSKRYADSLDTDALNRLPLSTKKTGVFVNATFEDISKQIKAYNLQAIQLHGDETPEFCTSFINNDIEVIKAFGIDKQFDFNTLNTYNNAVDYFLFDTKTDQYGGSGQVFNWDLLKMYHLEKPYFLSGGLGVEHLNEIKKINDTRLYALDFNSRFELQPGLKDIEKLTSVFNEIKIPV
ncbi:MAG TPA: phosphoribosylanthranilate isomerase [Segetibacter sp.]